MPTRFIKESCRSSRNLDRIADFEERLFWRLVTTADDYGRFQACHELVRALCFPYRQIPLQKIADALIQLCQHDLITLYTVKDRQYGKFVTWEAHQGKPRARQSKYPAQLDTFLQADARNCTQLHANVAGGSDTDTDLSSLHSLSESKEGKESEKGEFEQFWQAYPKKVGKKKAREEWGKAKDRPAIESICAAVERWTNSEKWKQGFILDPERWIKGARWLDEVPVEKTASASGKCVARTRRGNFFQPCGTEARHMIGGQYLCDAHAHAQNNLSNGPSLPSVQSKGLSA